MKPPHEVTTMFAFKQACKIKVNIKPGVYIPVVIWKNTVPYPPSNFLSFSSSMCLGPEDYVYFHENSLPSLTERIAHFAETENIVLNEDFFV